MLTVKHIDDFGLRFALEDGSTPHFFRKRSTSSLLIPARISSSIACAELLASRRSGTAKST